MLDMNLLYGQNEALKNQNKQLQEEILILKNKVLELKNEICILRQERLRNKYNNKCIANRKDTIQS